MNFPILGQKDHHIELGPDMSVISKDAGVGTYCIMTWQSSNRNCYCDRRNHHSTIRWWKNQSLFWWLNNKWRVDSLRQYITTPGLNLQGLSRCALDGCLPPILIDWYSKMNESCDFVCSQGKLLMLKLFFSIWINRDKFPKPQLTKSGHESVGRDVPSH